MLKSVSIKDFKCFHEKTVVPLKQVTIMYGKNGRGKSSVAQTLLLLSQTMMGNNDVKVLQIIGNWVELGTFDEILNSKAEDKSFYIGLQSEDESIEMYYSPIPGKLQLAQLVSMPVDGVERLEKNSTKRGEHLSSEGITGTTSDLKVLQALKKIGYIAADRRGPVNSVQRLDSLPENWLGTKGESLINVLAQKSADFISEVESALSSVLTGAAIRINHKDTERIELFLNSADGKVTYRPINVGFGYSYVLPVIVLMLLAEKGSIVIIENPEAHLHPGAQSRLMEFLILKAKERDVQLIVESHSDHVVNGVRIAVKKGELSEQNALINYFGRENGDETPEIEQIHVDENGELSCYPEDFMDEWTKQLIELIKK